MRCRLDTMWLTWLTWLPATLSWVSLKSMSHDDQCDIWAHVISCLTCGISAVRWFQLEFTFPKLVSNSLSHRVITACFLLKNVSRLRVRWVPANEHLLTLHIVYSEYECAADYLLRARLPICWRRCEVVDVHACPVQAVNLWKPWGGLSYSTPQLRNCKLFCHSVRKPDLVAKEILDTVVPGL